MGYAVEYNARTEMWVKGYCHLMVVTHISSLGIILSVVRAFHEEMHLHCSPATEKPLAFHITKFITKSVIKSQWLYETRNNLKSYSK